MNSRPVLSMNFYQAENGEYVNPFERMIKDARKEKVEQEEVKVIAINNTISSIEYLVDNFLPMESDREEQSSQKQNRKKFSGPLKYKKEYFQHMDDNLKQINDYLQMLQKQA